MQTCQQIRQLLLSAGISPNKRLGQNFLIDLNLMQLLVDSANITKDDIVLEAGSGTGSLTEALAAKAGMVIAVEIDSSLAKIARNYLSGVQNIEIINTDILMNKHNIARCVIESIKKAQSNFKGRLLLVANLPYNVASAVIANLIIGPVTADAMYVTIQKEVAQRITAEAGSEHYGTLSILMNVAGAVKIIRILKPTVFWPRPQVNSAMVSFVRDRGKIGRIRDITLLSEIINLFMQHRRKMLKACTKFAAGRLAGVDNWGEVFEQTSIDATARPEQIAPEEYLAIANFC